MRPSGLIFFIKPSCVHVQAEAVPFQDSGNHVFVVQDIFYEKADALVGVARDVDTACSRTFTFDLSAFGEPLPVED